MSEETTQTSAAAPAAPELTTEERDRVGEEQVKKQLQGDTGIVKPVEQVETQPDPRAEKRKELLRQLAALDDAGPDLQNMTDLESHVHFLDLLVEHLGSHPKLEAAWKNLRARMLAGIHE